MSAVDNLKAQGNAAFGAKDYSKAISLYTDAIELDPDNYTLYSNRSGAYCASQKYDQAVADARKVIQIKPDWVRGHTRLGAALQGQEDWEGAEEAYAKALELDPNNQNIKDDLASVRSHKEDFEAQAGNAMNNLFSPQNLDMLRLNPQVAPLFNDPSFSAMVEDLKRNPKNLSKYQNDQRLMIILQALLQSLNPNMGAGAPPPPAEEEEAPKPAPEAPKKEVVGNEAAEAEKNLGNTAFKAGNLEEALSHYDKAIELDPFNVVYTNNKASVLNKQGKYEEAIKLCEESIAKGREHNASYEAIARAYQKIASAQASMGKIDLAIESLKSSLLEKKDPQVQRELKRLENLLAKKKAQEYENPELAEQAKQEGNTFFANKEFPQAIERYSEAIKRAPRNPALYSNRAAAYSKLGELPMAIKDCEKAIEIDPQFVKAYTRKAYCHYMMKEYHKSRECYQEALKIDANNAEAIDGLRSIDSQIAKNRFTAPDEEQIKRNMQDPEIQRIVSDPGMQQILRDLQENPEAARHHLQDPKVRDAIMKLQAAGIVR
ncbi:TPR Domain containing protein [Tritrichomonas foetus]|uniref:TPR Domain containing protein n=1 Tax=Tritrichomonas foetus TaxID=1144522 RepID=A0A1J4KMN4_9EUKA|nr:TPR Domain containing protein [Tritrichomonas foetus]|eukprot:OHT12567.1 TPR Domain containing protein [Tritrichomonas foetus]